MVIIDRNKELITPVETILALLQQQLAVIGIDKLHDINSKQSEAQITCPIHKMGHENTPSCGILLQDKGDLPAGTVHCFTCGYKANIVKFTADCMNVSYRKATEWLLNVCTYNLLEEKRDVDEIVFDDDCDESYSTVERVTCEELKKYDFIHPYMQKRKLTDEIIEKYEVGFDPDTNSLTFPVYVNGECLFVARRTVYGKRFIMPKIDPKPIYGLDYINNCNTLYVTESVINALTLCSWGYDAVALFGTGSAYQADELDRLDVRKIVLCLDGDDAGKRGIDRLMSKLSDKIVTYKVMPTDGRDINDMSKEEFMNLEEIF